MQVVNEESGLRSVSVFGSDFARIQESNTIRPLKNLTQTRLGPKMSFRRDGYLYYPSYFAIVEINRHSIWEPLATSLQIE